MAGGYTECVVISLAWNAAEWVGRCLDSVEAQRYPHQHYWVDDASTDGTREILSRRVSPARLVLNSKRCYAAFNLWDLISQRLQGDPVIVVVDGDDWLSSPSALGELMDLHTRYDLVWSDYVTYTGDISQDSSPRRREHLSGRIRREEPWSPHHPLTFKRRHALHLAAEDLQLGDEWLRAAYDMAFAVPLSELLGDERCFFYDKVLYVYNCANGMNNHKMQKSLQTEMQALIGSRPPYSRASRGK